MARIATIGEALLNIYLVDHDDLTPTTTHDRRIFGKVTVGSEIDIDKVVYSVGGGGLNTAVSMSRYGHEVVMIGNIAKDAAGDAVLEALDREGIDSSYLNFVQRGETGTSVILLDSRSGERTILSHRGASGNFNNLSPADIEMIAPDWLYITSLAGDLDTLTAFLDEAHSVGAKIMFNPGRAEIKKSRSLMKLLGNVDILLLNKREAAALVPGVTLAELLYHLNNYARHTIITDGIMGGIAGGREDGESYRFGIYEDVRPRDITGAGDAFGAGFLAAYAAGNSLHDALIYGSANATRVITAVGATAKTLTGLEHLHPMPIQKIS